MKTTIKIISFLLFFSVISCDKEETKPTTNTNNGNTGTTATAPAFDASVASTTESITDVSLKISSTLKENGGSAITQHGHVWSDTKTDPTTSDSKTELGATTGPFPLKFTSEIKSLKANTTYSVRAYATNDKGTTYGAVVQMKTNNATIVSSGNFLFWGTEKRLIAMDISNNQLVWQSMDIGFVSEIQAPFIYKDLLVVAAGTNIYALDIKTGGTKWQFDTKGSNIALTLQKDIIYAASNDVLLALNAESGKQKWTYKAGGGIQNNPTVNDKFVYASSFGDGMIFALDKETGVLKWKRKGSGSIAVRKLNATNDFLIGSSANRDSNFVCFEAATGKAKWNGGRVGYYDVPTIINNIVYLAIEFDFSAYDIVSGKLLWKLATPTNSSFYPSSSFTVGNGFAYAIDGNGLLYGIDVTNGSKKWTFSKANLVSSTLLMENALYVLGEKSTSGTKAINEIHLLDAKTGSLKVKIDVSKYPPITNLTALNNGKVHYSGAFSIYQ